VKAVDRTIEKLLYSGGLWTINVNGSKEQINIHKQLKSPSSDILKYAFSTKQGIKGFMTISWVPRRNNLLEMNFSKQTKKSQRQQNNCRGILAKDMSFISGICTDKPFIMTSDFYQKNEYEKYAKNHADKFINHKLKQQNIQLNRDLSQCKQAKALPQNKYIDALEVANKVVNNLPYQPVVCSNEGIYSCDNADFTPSLDVPKTPPKGSKELGWLLDLLNKQDATINNLYNRAGYDVLKEKEYACMDLLKCIALYRQDIISETTALQN